MGSTVLLDRAARGRFTHGDLQPQLHGSVLAVPVMLNGAS